MLWAHCNSWRHLKTEGLNSGWVYLRRCKFVQGNIGRWWRPECVLTCLNKLSSQTRVFFSIQQHSTLLSTLQVHNSLAEILQDLLNQFQVISEVKSNPKIDPISFSAASGVVIRVFFIRDFDFVDYDQPFCKRWHHLSTLFLNFSFLGLI